MNTEASIIYRMLPHLVQRRIHKISSLRRSMTLPRKSETTLVYESSASSSSSTFESEASSTPPPSYRSSRVIDRHEAEAETWEESRRYAKRTLITYGRPETGHGEQSCSGINWKYANQGMKLLDQSLEESWATTTPSLSQCLARQLYIHACIYLLRGLPADMCTEEAIGIQNAVPPGIKHNIVRECSSVPEAAAAIVVPGSASQPVRTNRSMLHCAIAYMILQLFFLFNLVLPYVKLMMGVVYRFERRHRISERVFSAGVNGMDLMGKRGMEMSRAFCQLNNGQVGQYMSEIMVWWIRSVTGGIHEGIGEGLMVVRAGSGPVIRQSSATIEMVVQR